MHVYGKIREELEEAIYETGLRKSEKEHGLFIPMRNFGHIIFGNILTYTS